MQQSTLKHLPKALGQKHSVNLRYKKYFRKTSLKQKGVGDFFLNEVSIKRPKVFLEVGVFHGVTARNVCELLYLLHGNDFKYIGLDLFEKNLESKDEVIPNTKPTMEFSLVLPKAIIIIPIVAINIEIHTFIEICSLKNKNARRAVKKGIAAKHNNVIAAEVLVIE